MQLTIIHTVLTSDEDNVNKGNKKNNLNTESEVLYKFPFLLHDTERHTNPEKVSELNSGLSNEKNTEVSSFVTASCKNDESFSVSQTLYSREPSNSFEVHETTYLSFYETSLQKPDVKKLDELIDLNSPVFTDYGTCGFRMESFSAKLIPVLHRCTLFSYNESVRNHRVSISKKKMFFCPLAVGIIITASHNPISDNGIKIISPDGRLLDRIQIERCQRYVSNEITGFSVAETGILLLFKDTRPSGEKLVNEVKNVSKLINCKTIDCGIVSTPMAHYIVKEFNNELRKLNSLSDIVPDRMNMAGFKIQLPLIEKIKEKYFKTMKCFLGKDLTKTKIYYDSANGVAQCVLDDFFKLYKTPLFEHITPIGTLNLNCGADYLKTHGIPSEYNFLNKPDEILVSFDGDMDRIIFFKEANTFDGDDIIANFSEFILKTLYKNKIQTSVGIIISDYTNLGCVNFLKRIQQQFYRKADNLLKIDVVRAKTGIANFIEQALEYDIAVYFEPNGHGGIMFSERFKSTLHDNKSLDENFLLLKKSTEIFKPLIGDPLAVLLFSLKSGGISKKFEKTPSILKNIKIRESEKEKLLKMLENNIDRYSTIKCSCEECLTNEINKTNDVSQNRIFVRPSGTEPLIRILIEAQCKNHVDITLKVIEESIANV
ncbi:putative phosphoacetylglucosamine mutase [Cucumispora dikerogammari]|nr:putative phosphoacetylglucosamine mutase [Cucumispora dikerogammari]